MARPRRPQRCLIVKGRGGRVRGGGAGEEHGSPRRFRAGPICRGDQTVAAQISPTKREIKSPGLSVTQDLGWCSLICGIVPCRALITGLRAQTCEGVQTHQTHADRLLGGCVCVGVGVRVIKRMECLSTDSTVSGTGAALEAVLSLFLSRLGVGGADSKWPTNFFGCPTDVRKGQTAILVLSHLRRFCSSQGFFLSGEKNLSVSKTQEGQLGGRRVWSSETQRSSPRRPCSVSAHHHPKRRAWLKQGGTLHIWLPPWRK